QAHAHRRTFRSLARPKFWAAETNSAGSPPVSHSASVMRLPHVWNQDRVAANGARATTGHPTFRSSRSPIPRATAAGEEALTLSHHEKSGEVYPTLRPDAERLLVVVG